MDGIRAFELKVGIFVLIGIIILFVVVFSIGDLNLARSGYHIKAIFNFASGIGPSAPVRLAGVGVGQVEGIRIFYDEKDKRAKAEIYAWINSDARIEEDAKVTINTLGLLGEKYLEVFPGTSGKNILKDKDTIIGHDPMSMEEITENLKSLSESVTVIVDRLRKGEGTIGKLLVENDVYDDLKATTGNFREFSEDLKKHPWKLLSKPRGE